MIPAAADGRQLGELVTPKVRIDDHPMNEKSDRTLPLLLIGDVAARRLNELFLGHCKLLEGLRCLPAS
jgi:hypothetical protein